MTVTDDAGTATDTTKPDTAVTSGDKWFDEGNDTIHVVTVENNAGAVLPFALPVPADLAEQ